MSDLHRHRSRVAILTRHRGADAPEVVDARRDLATEQIRNYAQRILAEAPPLTDEQRMGLVRLLSGPPAAATAGGDAA